MGAGITYVRLDPARAVELLTERLAATSSRNTTSVSQSYFWLALAHLRLHQETAAARASALRSQ